MARKRSIGRKLLFVVNLFFAVALLCSYLAFYLPATLVPGFSFAGLAYPVLLLLNLGFVLFWALKFDKRIVLSTVVIALGAFHMQRLYQLNGQNKVVNPTNTVRVMSYNVRMFNLYKWIESDGVAEEIKSIIVQAKPEVLFLQEYYQTDITPTLDYAHHYTKMTNRGKNYGLAIFSSYPILETGTITYDGDENRENNEFIFADISLKGKRLRFINAHLASVGLDNKDYVRIENPTEGTQEEIEKGVLQIAQRLHRAFKRRAVQIEALKRAILESPYPVVLAGDFNDTPTSYTYHQIDLLLEDSFLQAGQGFSKTYTNKFLPLRIDYIFHDASLKAFNYKVIPKKLSDHYPIFVELEL
jgi:endonuclease/exonuclease/phosphatase family metal-dependent hydrolase